MDLKPGSRWKSAVCTAEAVVVRPPNAGVTLECGGQAMLGAADVRAEGLAAAEGFDGGAAVGKRYADETSGLEVLCSKSGGGAFSADGRLLTIKEAKKLPASD
ncbi:hypothetical protein [Phenylobacterium montanum]|uniref:Uncharacterized protein n=1 Tax=Phenylobacterium montanum TaxID=2823693 RepID=A0A975G4E5_9CAUL|nr:hypothetical protein [Caulobacter sp. S6]QUD90368.1 hypothetical protein KCG34_11145 [Caulobacter sp. S6]